MCKRSLVFGLIGTTVQTVKQGTAVNQWNAKATEEEKGQKQQVISRKKAHNVVCRIKDGAGRSDVPFTRLHTAPAGFCGSHQMCLPAQ